MSVTFPPEILDKIFEQIATTREGPQTLAACALVATRWAGLSQRRLFYSVEIHELNYERWMNSVVLPEPKTHLLEYVRSLGHLRGLITRVTYRMGALAQHSGKYLSVLRNLRSLRLRSIWVEDIDEDQFHTCFSTFRETLTYLSLDEFAASFGAFVTLVAYFPNITTLQLDMPKLVHNDRPVPSLSRPFRGKLQVCNVQAESLEFLNRFAELDPDYEELVIGPSRWGTEYLQSVLQVSTRNVKFLMLADNLVECE